MAVFDFPNQRIPSNNNGTFWKDLYMSSTFILSLPVVLLYPLIFYQSNLSSCFVLFSDFYPYLHTTSSFFLPTLRWKCMFHSSVGFSGLNLGVHKSNINGIWNNEVRIIFLSSCFSSLCLVGKNVNCHLNQSDLKYLFL